MQKNNIIRNLSLFYKWRSSIASNLTVGFVPTMGALHDGHVSLVSKSLKENDITIVSIFVNPTQFDNPDDYKKYPNLIEEDIRLLKKLHCDCVLVPTVNEVYPEDFVMKDYDLGSLDKYMEGNHRKGHFIGVVNVVKRLFDIVKPTNAYFGEKDFQQLAIIKKLIEIEQLPIKIIGCPIIRNDNQLALSSRNKRLSEQALEKSKIIPECLDWAKENIFKLSTTRLEESIKNKLADKGIELEYFCFCNERDLVPINGKIEDARNIRGFIAAFIDEIRLIDNKQMY